MTKNLEQEIWKDIDGYEGIYQISNLGRLKSLERKINYGNRILKEKILKSPVANIGYCMVNLYKDNSRKLVLIHRLVAVAFIPNPKNKLEVNHIDSNKLNNKAENLEWATKRENLTHYCLTKKSSSSFTGVCWNKRNKNWLSQIKINNKLVNLGSFKSEIDASNAYQEKVMLIS